MKFYILHVKKDGKMKNVLVKAENVRFSTRVVLTDHGDDLLDLGGAVEAWTECEGSERAIEHVHKLDASLDNLQELLKAERERFLEEKKTFWARQAMRGAGV